MTKSSTTTQTRELWRKEFPRANGFYWMRCTTRDRCLLAVEVQSGRLLITGLSGDQREFYDFAGYEFLGPITPSTTEQVIRLREALEPQPRLLTVEALEAVTNYFWSAASPVLSESEVQELVESALRNIKANTLDEGTLEWCAQWILDSLTGETNERVIEFAKNMAMTFRAALQPKAKTEYGDAG